TASADFPTTVGAYQTVFGGVSDAFAARLNPTFSALGFSSFLGGDDIEEAYGIKVNSDQEVYLSGMSESQNFPVSTDAIQGARNGIADAVLAKFSASGSWLIYSTYFGVSGGDYGSQIDISSCGDVHITGGTRSFDFPTRQAFQPANTSSSGNVYSAFVTKFTFLKTIESAPDASADGPFATTVSEYKLPAGVDTEVLDLPYTHPLDGLQPLEVELWASIYRPTTLSGTYPILVFLHGNHGVCERNSTPEPTMPPPPPGVNLRQ